MEKLNFDSGMRTYEVNDTATVSFNPTDIEFANSVFKLAEKFEEIRSRNEKLPKDANVYDAIRESDKEMRNAVDAIFGDGISAEIFGKSNVFSPCDGLPMVLNFLLAVLDEVDKNVEKAVRPSPRVNAYLEKYGKKYGVK